MDTPKDPPLGMWLLRVFAAFWVSGFYGVLGGAGTGGSIGMFFFFVGIVPGIATGSVVGFVAAIFGAAIGTYRGWTYSGGVCGFLGGLFLYKATAGAYPPDYANFAWFLALTAPATIGGLVMGYRAAKGVKAPGSRYGKWLEPLRVCLAWARLYELPVEMRFVVASVNLALAALAVRILIVWFFASGGT